MATQIAWSTRRKHTHTRLERRWELQMSLWLSLLKCSGVKWVCRIQGNKGDALLFPGEVVASPMPGRGKEMGW